MKGNGRSINLILLISIIGGLALTAPEYAACKDLFPDEFLDLGLACQGPIFPVFASHRNTHPLLLSRKILYFQKDNLLFTILRC
jgi:hypothetical protein